MRRGARGTLTPARASRYSGCPPCLMAEYIGGTCSSTPRKRCSTAVTCAALKGGTGRACVTAPSASPVAVALPSATLKE